MDEDFYSKNVSQIFLLRIFVFLYFKISMNIVIGLSQKRPSYRKAWLRVENVSKFGNFGGEDKTNILPLPPKKKCQRVAKRIALRQTKVFHDLSAIQEWQYCQLCFGHAIQNKDQ